MLSPGGEVKDTGQRLLTYTHARPHCRCQHAPLCIYEL